MSEFRKPTTRTIQARALTDPKPRFVSIVQAGANQTPIRSIKVDVVNTENEAMTTQIQALKADGHEVARLAFKIGDTFADKEKVEAFLTEGGYDVTKLAKTDDGFELVNDVDEFSETREVKVSDDLTVTVGKVEGGEATESDPDAEAAARANKAGSVITDVQVIDKKDDGQEAQGDETPTEGEEFIAGIDGSMKSAVRKRSRKVNPGSDADAEATEKQSCGEGMEWDVSQGKCVEKKGAGKKKEDDESTKGDCGCDESPCGCHGEEGTSKQTEADCGPDEVFMDGKCVKSEAKSSITVKDIEFELSTEPLELAPGITLEPGFFEATEKVEVLEGDCGPGFTMVSTGGRSFCVPTGDRTPPVHPSEVTPSDPSGGQGSAGFGGTAPAAGQNARRDDSIRAKFDEFSAHFSDGMSLAEVMDDANDGFPPGLQEVILAAVMAMRNNFLAGDAEAARAIGTELGDVAAQLGSMFSSVERSEDRMKMIDLASGQFSELGWPKVEEETAKATSGDDAVAAVTTAVKALLEDFKVEVTGAINQVKSEVADTKKQVDETTADLTDRVEKASFVAGSQTRKGADDGDDANGSTEPVKKSPIAGLRLRGALGITNAAKTDY